MAERVRLYCFGIDFPSIKQANHFNQIVCQILFPQAVASGNGKKDLEWGKWPQEFIGLSRTKYLCTVVYGVAILSQVCHCNRPFNMQALI